MRRAVPLLVARGPVGASRGSASAAASPAASASPAAATTPSVNAQLGKLKGQLSMQPHGTDADRAPQSLVHVSAMHILSDASKHVPLWIMQKGDLAIRSPHAFWMSQLGEAGRFLHSAGVFGASTTTARVQEALQWLRDHDADIAQHAAPSALSLVTTNVLALRDGGTNGTTFVLATLVPLMASMLRRSLEACRAQRVATGDCSSDASARMLELKSLRSIVAPFTLVRQLLDAVAQRPHASSTPDGVGASLERQATALQHLRAAAPQLKNLLLASCTLLVQVYCVHPHPTAPTGAPPPPTPVQMDCHAWNGVVSTIARLQLACPSELATALSRLSAPSAAGGQPANTSGNNRSGSLTGLDATDVAEMYQILHETLVRSLEQPSVDTVLMSSAAETTSWLHRLIAKPSDVVYLFNNLVTLAQHVSPKALVPMHQTMYLMPDAMKRSTARDVVRLLVGLSKWRQYLSNGKHLEDRTVVRILESCRVTLFRQAKEHLRLPDAVVLITQLSKLRVNTPIDMIDLLCDCCLANQQEMTVGGALQLIQGLHRLVEWHEAHAQHDSVEKWRAFRNRRLVHTMHVILHRVEAIDASPSHNNDAATSPISSSDALHLVDTYATLNNATSIAMYRLMRPRLLAAMQQESDGTLSLKEVNLLIVALGSLRKVSTSTHDEEQLLAHAEQERSLLLQRSQERLLDEAPVLDVVHFLTFMVNDVSHRLSKQSNAGSRAVQPQDDDEDDGDDDSGTSVPNPAQQAADAVGVDGVSSQLQLEALRKAVDQIPRCAAVANGAQLGGFARLLARLHRNRLLPTDVCVAAATVVVTASVMNCASVPAHAVASQPPVTALAVTKGPQGTMAVHDVCSMVPLLSLIATSPSSLMEVNAEANRHVWAIVLHRIRLLAPDFQPRDVRLIAHMMTDLEDVFADPLLSAPAWGAWAALMDATLVITPKVTLSEVSALVASMHAVRRFGDGQGGGAVSVSTRPQQVDDVDDNEDAESGGDDTADNEDDEGAASTGQDAATMPTALLSKWDGTMDALAKRAASIVAASTASTAVAPAVRSPMASELKWAIRVLKGFANNEPSLATAAHVRAFFYAVLPLLRAHAQQIGSVDLSLALHAFAKVGIWNVVAMEPLIQSACDGLAVAPVRQCVALLHTIVRSGFVRPEMVVDVAPRSGGARLLAGVAGRGAPAPARGSNEAMEQVTTLLCQRIGLELETAASTLGDKELLAVVNATSFFASPPRPLFDAAMLEVCRRTCDGEGGAAVSSAMVQALVALLSHAHKLHTAADQVAVSSRAVSCCLAGHAWRMAVLHQPIGRIVNVLDCLLGACVIAQPPAPSVHASNPAPSWGVDMAESLQTLVHGWIQRHTTSWTPHGLMHVLSRMERLSVLYPSVEPWYAQVLAHVATVCPYGADERARAATASSGTVDTALLRAAELWTPAAAAALTKLLLLRPGGISPNDALPFIPESSQDEGEAPQRRVSTHDERLVQQTVALAKATLGNAAPRSSSAPIPPPLSSIGMGGLMQLQCHRTHALLSTLRRSPLDCVVWCLRALSHFTDPEGKLSPLLLHVEQVFFERWHADARDPTSLGLFASVLLDAVTMRRLAAGNATLVRRAPMLLAKIAHRAAHGHGVGYAPSVLQALDRRGFGAVEDDVQVSG